MPGSKTRLNAPAARPPGRRQTGLDAVGMQQGPASARQSGVHLQRHRIERRLAERSRSALKLPNCTLALVDDARSRSGPQAGAPRLQAHQFAGEAIFVRTGALSLPLRPGDGKPWRPNA